MRKKALFRIRILTGLVLLVSLILIARLYQVQVIQGEHYASKAENQYVHTTAQLYSRGAIYFTTKDGEAVSAAAIKSGYVLALDPSRLVDAEGAYEVSKDHINIDKEVFMHRANLPNRTFVEIEDQLIESAADEIETADIDGVMLYRNQWRYYPGKDVSARTIGFVGYNSDGTDLHGKYGLERQYDHVLWRNDEKMSVNFFAEIFGNIGNLIFDRRENNEADVVTTIEPTVARILDGELMKVNDKYGSVVTGGIIINPKDGSIYALNTVPTFDPNDRSGVPIEDFQNPLVESVYEMGSIIKPLTVASGLDDGAITAQSTYYDEGFLELNDFTISNYDGKGRGTVDMQQVLNQSLNTGVAEIVKRMGRESFRNYFKSLQLGSETGIDLPNEAFGLVDNLDAPRDVEYATASFGQGIALTPISTVRALSALGNGGYLITPHIVSSIEYTDGSEKEIKYPRGAQVFEGSTSEEISRMLTVVVDEALKNGDVSMDRYSIAAKTGTAQMADLDSGGYYEDKFLHSFFGYFPSYDPEFLVFLYTVEPQGVRYASETLTDPFMELTKFLINYYNIPPDR